MVFSSFTLDKPTYVRHSQAFYFGHLYLVHQGLQINESHGLAIPRPYDTHCQFLLSY